ncbi:MAG: carbamoyltransferase HypF, partial [Desulfovibrio sp.]|nr:carbamoyltransferase HypF [Desulfovibrio sp.]
MQSSRIHIFGIVQGVGFRPFVHRLALEHNFLGTVANKGSYVEVFLQSTKDSSPKEVFLRQLVALAPPRSLIMKLNCESVELPPFKDFAIIESAIDSGDIFVSPDIAICEDCQSELFSPDNRRYLHPFINCTACGPRLTILDAMPYDRERTSMKHFPMCENCHREYTDPATRRYDAQPVSCHDCGPVLRLYELESLNTISEGAKASFKTIHLARKALQAGKILAIKGLGGFHLACDATNDEAVQLLRARKHRPTKPLAIMVRDLAAVKSFCLLSKETEAQLTGWQKPIVLLDKRKQPPLSEFVAPNNPSLGVMLPYTPLHLLLFNLPDKLAMTSALIMTSANISGAPICHTDELVQKELLGIADLVLTNNRPINLRCDDSVLLPEGKGQLSLLRRSRGYAPLPILVPSKAKGEVLGLGGELKNTFCLGKNDLFYLSNHVGDLSDVRTIQALRDSLKRLKELLVIKPKVVACDAHPLYNSRTVAEELDLPVLYVQHH